MEGLIEFINGGSALIAAAGALILGFFMVLLGLLMGKVALRKIGTAVSVLSLLALLAIFAILGADKQF